MQTRSSNPPVTFTGPDLQSLPKTHALSEWWHVKSAEVHSHSLSPYLWLMAECV